MDRLVHDLGCVWIDRETELMRQRTLAEEGFERYRKPTHREKFLDEMQQVIPWSGLLFAW